MNKLVIVGNGFDLAHGLKTSYEDFVLWHLNKVSESVKLHTEDLLVNYSCTRGCRSFQSISDFFLFTKDYNFGYKSIFKSSFYEKIVKSLNQSNAKEKRWVDIEREYFKELVKIQSIDITEDNRAKMLLDLNGSLELIKNELETYLSSEQNIGKPLILNEIRNNLRDIFVSGDSLVIENSTMVLNFNYTDTTRLYLSELKHRKVSEIFIHGRLNDNTNPIIFGYGDESDGNYDKIEKLYKNEYLKHMKSFAYLQTSNYKKLFDFLDKEDEKFEVFIMGHSCGLSDRLLFSHIFEHQNFNSVKIFYYDKPDGSNDFFERTQEISRYFRLDAKHKMRKVLVPFNESVPLVKYNSIQ